MKKVELDKMINRMNQVLDNSKKIRERADHGYKRILGERYESIMNSK